MELIRESYCMHLLLFLRGWFLTAWRESGFRPLCQRWGGNLRRTAQSSAVCDFLWREGTVSRHWRESWSCFLFDGLLAVPCVLASWVYQAGRRLWDGSFFCRLLLSLSGRTAVVLGVFFLVMLVAPHSRWNNAYGFLGAVAVALLFVLGCAGRPARRLEGAAFGPYMLFYLLCVFSGLAASLSTSLSMRFFLFHAASFMLAMLIYSSVERTDQLRWVIGLTIAGITIAALYGCYQGVIGVEIIESQQDMKVNANMPGRIYGFFDNPNNFAEMLEMLIPLDLGLLLTARGWRQRLASLAALAPCLAAIGLTYSRSGWIGLALAVCVMIALLNWRLVPVMLVLGVLAVPFLPETIYNRILTIGNMKDTSTQYRFAIYESTGNLLKDYWFRGVGLGTDVLKETFKRYPTMFDGNHPIHTHNNYLEMWVETGLLGLIAYLALLLHGAKTALRQFCRTTDRDVRRLLAAAMGAFCGISVISVAEYTWFYPRNMFFYWILFGIILTCVKLGRISEEARQS